MTKPGWKTSELWLTLLAQLLPILVITGILTQAEAQTLNETIVQAVLALGALVAAAAPIWKYIDSRTRVKTGK